MLKPDKDNAFVLAFGGNLGNQAMQTMFGSQFQESNVVVVMPPISASGIAGRSTGDNADLLAATSLPEWVLRTLADNGIVRISEVSALTDGELLQLRGVGQRSVKLIRSTIISHRRRRKLGLIDP
jgi:hypothetical protein